MSLAGAVVWGVVPFVPEPPFQLYAGLDRNPVTVESAGKLVQAARRGADAEFKFLVRGKTRPLLILSDGYDERVDELLGLRLLRLSEISEHQQRTVRAQDDPALFHLKPERFTLPDENAAMIGALIRVHRESIDPTPLGRLEQDELRVVHERVARHYRLDLHLLVLAELQRLARAHRRG